MTHPDPRTASKPRPRSRGGILGPLFGWELVRLARRGQDHRARFLLAAGLLAVLTLFTLIWFRQRDPFEVFFGTAQTLSIRESARFGEQFTLAFLLAQMAILILLTPAYAAGGISDEKEKKTFPFLLVSELTNLEIVLGKLMGRLTFLLGIFMAGLPVLALTQVYGGTSEKFLLMGYLLTGGTVVMLSAVSAAAALATDTYRSALFRGYGFAALHALVGGVYPILSPFAYLLLLWSMEDRNPEAFWVLGLGYFGVELVIALIALWIGYLAVKKLRAQPTRRIIPSRGTKPPEAMKPAQATATTGPPVEEILILGEEYRADHSGPVAVAQPLPVLPASATKQAPPRKKFKRPKVPRPRRFDPPDSGRSRPPVDEADPFRWKETYTTGNAASVDDANIRGVLMAVGISMGVILASLLGIGLLAAVASRFSEASLTFLYNILMAAGIGSYFTYLLTIAASATGTIIKERQRLTLESLLTIPVDKGEILRPKWNAACQRSWWWGLPASMMIPIVLVFSHSPTLAIPGLLFVLAGIPLTTSFGLWLSMRCKTMSRAVLWALPMIGFVVLMPSWTAWMLGPHPFWGLGVMTALAVVAVLAGELFWRLACRDFTPEKQLH